MDIIEQYESAVRSYSRGFPVVFDKAKNYTLTDTDGREYIDFFAGAGALNYGHNDEAMKAKILEYIQSDRITHSLDMATVARQEFLQTFHDVILEPRGMDYKVMFPGPTGTNTVESALKLARKVTGRRTVVSFTNAFHGMTLGALAVTGNQFKRNGAGKSLNDTVFMPFDGALGCTAPGCAVDTLDYFEAMVVNGGSGLGHPAAVIVEPVQGEGGINAASADWLKRLDQLCKKHDIKLIVDDVQAGCGRTGTFFSFEPAGIDPDFICLSKSIGGYGMPMAITLIKPEYDKFAPGEHNGTFRGNNPAFVAATTALETYWRDDQLAANVRRMGETIRAKLSEIAAKHTQVPMQVRGRGFMQGLAIHVDGLAEEVAHEAFKRGLIMETSGPADEVAKLLPPLTLDDAGLNKGLEILAESVDAAIAARTDKVGKVA
jgi:diaminobutyrate-2-oxoglutarate transaminase